MAADRDLVPCFSSQSATRQSRLARLQHLFGLSEGEFDLLQMCLAVLLDPVLARVYAYLHDHAGRGYPTEELAIRLFGHNGKSLWMPESPLCRWELVREKEVGPGEPTQLTCDTLIKDWLQGHNGAQKGLSLRYVGSLVADFHRNLLSGGVFYYPADTKDPEQPQGKLRLLYEAIPLAFLAEQAGGYASDGRQAILDIQPTSLHQRTPLFVGNRNLVEKAESFIREHDR